MKIKKIPSPDPSNPDENKKKKEKILIVDDEKLICLALSELLTSEGYEVYTAINGKRAIELCRTHCFALIFLDIIMPDLNGLETFRQVKTFRPDIKAILITGYIEDAEQFLAKAVTEGMIEEYLRKPFYNQEIMDAVEKYIR